MHILLLLPCLASMAFATPIVQERQTSAAPAVTIKNGTVVGSSDGTVDTFKGIPFAQPPTGTLRLKPPHTIATPYGTITATGTPTACPQFYEQVDTTNLASDVAGLLLDSPFVQAATVQGEDCLTLNVQRPSTATSSSKLPVLFWIFGGGFEFGSTQSYDATNIIKQSIALGNPILYVAVNYRLGGFGFLAGKEVQADGSTNLGLRDQRLGLQWVQDNVAAFGGDPARVTIWGESAGSISVFDQTIINGGNNLYNGKPLFRAAIMDSGCVIPAEPVNISQAETVYDTVVANAGCSGSSNTLACLRTVPYEQYLNAANSVPGIFSYRSVDLSYLPRPDPNSTFFPVSPEIAVQEGAYAKVPIIIGDQQDEGTLFSLTQSNITTSAELVSYLASYFPQTSSSIVAGLVATYPDDPSAGSPFNTGPLYNIYPEYKRLAAILGDVVFTLTRRVYLNSVASHVPAWSYLATYLYGTPVAGTFHSSDVNEIYDGAPDAVPAKSIQNYYISFVNQLNPNAITSVSTLVNWPNWNSQTAQLLNFQALVNTVITDNFRNASYEYLLTHQSDFRV